MPRSASRRRSATRRHRRCVAPRTARRIAALPPSTTGSRRQPLDSGRPARAGHRRGDAAVRRRPRGSRHLGGARPCGASSGRRESAAWSGPRFPHFARFEAPSVDDDDVPVRDHRRARSRRPHVTRRPTRRRARCAAPVARQSRRRPPPPARRARRVRRADPEHRMIVTEHADTEPATPARTPCGASWPEPRPTPGPTTGAVPLAHGLDRGSAGTNAGGSAATTRRVSSERSPAWRPRSTARSRRQAPPASPVAFRPLSLAGDHRPCLPARRRRPPSGSTASTAGRSTTCCAPRAGPPPPRRPRPRGAGPLDDALRQRPRLRVPAGGRRLRARCSPDLVPSAISMVEMSGGIFGAIGTTEHVLAALRAAPS